MKMRLSILGRKVWNEAQRREIGLRQAGEKSSSAKLSNNDAENIRRLYAKGVSYRRLMDDYSVSKASIFRVIGRRTYK